MRGLGLSSVRALLRGLPSSAPVAVQGWVRSVRRQRRYSFLELNDGSSPRNLQVVWGEGSSEGLPFSAGDAAHLTTGASVRVRGVLAASPKAGQSVELSAASLEVLGGVDASYPLQKKAHSAEFLREVLHLRARGGLASSVLRLRHTLANALHAHLQAQGLLQVHAPVLTGNDCEGAGEMFAAAPVAWPPSSPPFFGRPAHLTVSAQLHLEAFAHAMGAVYSFGPTFRAENSNTSRHLAEFWMVEPEIAPGDLHSAMDLCQGALSAAAGAALRDGAEDVAFLDRQRGGSSSSSGGAPAAAAPPAASASAARLVPLEDRLRAAEAGGFARLTYAHALEVLNEGSAPLPRLGWGADLSSEHERWLSERFVGGPVFVTHYPATLKPFYMKRTRGSGGGGVGGGGGGPTVDNFDLLVPGLGELAGGSAREHDGGLLGPIMAAQGLLSPAFAASVQQQQQQQQQQVVGAGGAAQGAASSPPHFWGLPAPVADPSNGFLDWYLDLRRYGSVPSAGWGLGFERLVAWAGGLDNVRDAVPCPRVRNSCSM